MMTPRLKKHSQSGAAMVEFALTASFFLLMLCAIVSGGHLFFTHNAMVEATRRGARYAATQCKPNLAGCANSAGTVDRVRNMVLYGTTTAGTSTLVYNLQATAITVVFSNDFNVGQGNVSVRIDGYQYQFAVGGLTINMPTYKTTVAGESAGIVPESTCTP